MDSSIICANFKLANSKKQFIYVNAYSHADQFTDIENMYLKDFDQIPVFITGTYLLDDKPNDVLKMAKNEYNSRAKV